jgi:signal transduction histidine kinase/ligand-binding sensor domain-containing protein/DNA-binding response OmpR family regulator
LQNSFNGRLALAARLADLKSYWIIILHIFLTVSIFAQTEDIKFEKLMVDDGLSHNIVRAIINDHRGFMWFGTTDGLCRYDGYNFKVYKNIPGDTTRLSGNQIRGLYEDRSGQIWIGTEWSGLCRFDSQTDGFVRYSTKNGLTNPNVVSVIFESVHDNKTILWVGTGVGLNKYDPDTDSFTHYFPEGTTGESYRNKNFIASIVQDSSSRVWVATWLEGLFYYDIDNDRLVKYKPNPEYAGIFRNKLIRKLYASREQSRNILWVATRKDGLFKIDLQSGRIRNWRFNKKSIDILDIYADKKELGNIFWLASDNGIYRLDTRTDQFTHYKSNPQNPKSLSSNMVYTIIKDNSGILWAGTIFGVNKFNPQVSNFRTFEHNPSTENSLINNNVKSLYETHINGRKILWIGTEGGLSKYDRETKRFTNFRHDPHRVNSLSSNIINYIHSSRANRNHLWLATENGLNRLNIQTGSIERFIIDTEDTDMANRMYVLCEDNEGLIWIGTHTSIYSFSPITEIFDRQITNLNVNTMILNSYGDLYFAFNGLKKYNINSNQSKRYMHNSSNPNSIINNRISAIYQDRSNNFWIATLGGLDRFNPETEIFTHFSKREELQGIIGILEDSHNNLWLATNKNILKFNPQNNELKSYSKGDGLLANQFSSKAIFKNEDGEMFFGGHGFNIFHPDSLVRNSYIPPVVITDFQIFNQSVRPGKNSILHNQIFNIKAISLPHYLSVFSFEFAALDYHNPQENLYAYTLEGFDQQWVNIDASRRHATYTNLDPGEYIFQVKGSNNDGVWNEKGTSIKFTILPPWWKTWWAYSFYIALVLGTLYSLRRYELIRQRFKHNLELKDLEAQKFLELDRMKSRFFANISHEFRTPLTLISGPIERLLSGELVGDVKEQYHLILRNTRRLLRLVNQLLDISRLESGKMKLQARPENIVELTKQLTMAFESLASVNDIELQFIGSEEPVTVYLDREHYEKIITNLLSNALKFTPEGGEVIVDLSLRGDMARTMSTTQSRISRGDEIASPDIRRVRKDSNNLGFVQIKITDTGSGIPADHLPHIFDRFYQVGDSYVKDSQGSGIGLALTKELVELHHGEIEVSSEVGKGTEFTIWLPLGKEHLKKEEIVDIPLNPPASLAGRPSKGEIEFSPRRVESSTLDGGARRAGDVLADIPAKKPASRPQTSKSAPLLLIVEDNSDMRTYIRQMLAESYKVVEAADGQEGFEKAAEIIPDIIISDVMMPEMDGFQFCEKIKTDQRTSHIPIILLTAKASGESKIEGLETGVDNYLAKPFDTRELQARLKNLIDQRRKLRERFSREIYLNPKEITVTSMDERFLQKASQIVETKISDPEFSVDDFVKEMALSRTDLYRKLKALTGLSAKEFIRTIRLKRAAHLLRHQYGNISEIAYEVGFNNPSYFAECFHKQFKQLPSQYKSKHIGQSSS